MKSVPFHRCNFQYYELLLPSLLQCTSSELPPHASLHLRSKAYNTFFFILSGSGTLTFEDGFSTIIHARNLLFFQDFASATIVSGEEPLHYLMLQFQLFAHDVPLKSSPNDPSSEMEDFSPEKSTRPFLRLAIGLEPILYINKFSQEEILLEHIDKELCALTCGYSTIIKTLLTELIVTLFRTNQKTDTTLQNVSCVCFSSLPDSPVLLKRGQSVWITDVKIWSGVSDDVSQMSPRQLLRNMKIQNYYFSAPSDPTKLTFSLDTDMLYEGAPTGRLDAFQISEYTLFLNPDINCNAIDLRPYKEEGVITFAIRSNQTGAIGFDIVNTTNYSPLSTIVPIDTANEWIPVTVPLKRSEQDKVTSPAVRSTLDYIRNNYKRPITLSEISQQIHIDTSYLCTLFKKEMHCTIGSYIRSYRILIAQNLLIESDMKILQIAHECGFYDLSHFVRTFQSIAGISPTAFRNQRR